MCVLSRTQLIKTFCGKLRLLAKSFMGDYILNADTAQYVFLDSGIGGLPYLKRLTDFFPEASYAYVADIKHFPYGEKTLDEVIRFSSETVKKIIETVNPKIIVIACNTMSVSALPHLRASFRIPFVGTVPAIKPAAAVSKNKKIAVLATERTVNDIYTQKLIDEFGGNCHFFMRADSVLVKKIEEGILDSSETEKKKIIFPAIEFFKAAGADTAVLGCTHFLHLRDVFIQECAPRIKIIDSLDGVVNQVLKISPVDEAYKKKSKDKLYITARKNSEIEKKYFAYAHRFNMQLEYLQ